MRTWLLLPLIFFVTVVYAMSVIVHMLLFRDKTVFYRYARSWSRMLLRVAGVTVIVRGQEHLDATVRYVYVANHSSLFDIPVVLACVPDNIRIMYKRELNKIPVFGWCLALSPFIPLDRADGRDALAKLDATIASMRDGTAVLVFPEGTRSEDGMLGDFKRGAFVLAARSGMPIVPLAILGSAAILPARKVQLNKGTVTLVISEPMQSLGTSRADEMKMLSNVRSVLHEHVVSHL